MDRSAVYQRLEELSEDTDLGIGKSELEKFTALLELLEKWNKSLNLTAIRDPMEMAVLHIMDSASVSPLICGKNVADIGTGAGFPGLVLSILQPETEFTLVDSVAKKLSFVRTAAVTLRLLNVKIINSRCENLKAEKKFDCIVCRAFAPLEKIVTWCLPLLAPDGRFVAMKANLEAEELKAVPESVKIDQIIKLHVPQLEAVRQAVIMSHIDAD